MDKNRDPFRLDANESVFFKRELEYIKTKSYDTKYKELKSFALIPISTEAPSGASEITYRKYSGVGFAKFISDYAIDFPRVDIFGEEVTTKIYPIGDSYGYSIKEIRRSQQTGKRLDQRRAAMARRGMDQKIDKVAWFGDTTRGINGFIDYPGITQYTVPAGVGGVEWEDKTPDEIVADLSGIVTSVIDTTNGVEQPDTMLMPIEQYNYIANTRMTGNTDKTIMRFFLDNNPFIKMIDWLTELKGAGAGGTDRFMVYKKDPNNLTLEIPQMFEQFTAQQKGMEFEIPCHAETAGIIVYYPLSIAFGDGI